MYVFAEYSSVGSTIAMYTLHFVEIGTYFFVLMINPNRIAACSKCLQITLVSSVVYAMVAAG